MLHVDRDGPGHRAEHEPDGNRQHVDDDDVLERARVEREESQIRRPRRRRSADPSANAPASAKPPSTTADVSAAGTGKRAGGNRPPRLERMLAIAVAVRDVVDQVHDAGQQAEDAEGGGRPSDRRDDRTDAGRTATRRRPADSSPTGSDEGKSGGSSARERSDRLAPHHRRGRSAARHLARARRVRKSRFASHAGNDRLDRPRRGPEVRGR